MQVLCVYSCIHIADVYCRYTCYCLTQIRSVVPAVGVHLQGKTHVSINTYVYKDTHELSYRYTDTQEMN